MGIAPDIRDMLQRRCRSQRTRRAVFSPSSPIDWRPGQLRNPSEPTTYFTEAAAWEFVAQAIAEGCEMEIIVLDKPLGKKAYVMILDGHPTGTKIYVKLQLGADCVIGRSFHQSER